MQSDKLPKMPVPVGLRYNDVQGKPDYNTVTAVFTEEQMRDYALAARKAVLEEAVRICKEQGSEWDSDAVVCEKNYALHCAELISGIMEQDA